jgi:hypothetical protein
MADILLIRSAAPRHVLGAPNFWHSLEPDQDGSFAGKTSKEHWMP